MNPRYSVYHANQPNFMGDARIAAAQWPDGFTQVAVVEADNKDQVFSCTNHVYSNWTDNAGVESFTENPRSTSVGDVIEDESGVRWMVAFSGWTRIGSVEGDAR